MIGLSNSLSLLRAPLAFLFLYESMPVRITAIILAMLTDMVDGYLARKRRAVTRLGAILDPAMDKFFVFFILSILLMEKRLPIWQACAIVSRDFFLCLFGLYLSFRSAWSGYRFQSIRWGKVSTALQFFILIGLVLGYNFPSYLYLLFITLGLLSFIELFKRQLLVAKQNSP